MMESNGVISLGSSVEPLRQAFNDVSDALRLLMLVSPTCGPCREGASIMQRDVLDAIGDPALRAFVAWVPILPADCETAAIGSASLVPDERARHFWDQQKALPGPFSKALSLPDGWPAWDVYLAYPAGVTWGDAPPNPAFWHHQLGPQANAPRLDGPTFRTQLQRLFEGR